jgi:hypothetical protein
MIETIKKGRNLLTKSIVHIHKNNLLIEENGTHMQELLLEKQLFQNMEQGYQLKPKEYDRSCYQFG